ncbi:RNA methyltransferase [Pontibacter sp. G13]|nr:RNA methyltransferase [Pontibacter sp. G13]WNJ18529.1 RNA methyltransferase [Pontibacter sp. G13]
MKKYRYRHRRFVVEGWKMVQEAILERWKVEAIVVREGVELKSGFDLGGYPCFQTSEEAFQKLSSQTHPEGILAIVEFPETGFGKMDELDSLPEGPGLILQDIQDPGNLGTILRTADWFGIKQVICSKGCSDILNPKVLRATMGAIFRVEVSYTSDLTRLLRESKQTIWAADMEGENLAETPLAPESWVLIGNEANGIDRDFLKLPAVKPLTIPRIGKTESLNAGMAAGILMWQLSFGSQSGQN